MTVLEGTWEEIQKYGSRLIGRRLRLTILDEESKSETIKPNRKMSEIMNAAKRKQAKMRFTDGSKTQQILRKARNGGMFE